MNTVRRMCTIFCSVFGTLKKMPIITRRIRALSLHVLVASWQVSFPGGLILFGPFAFGTFAVSVRRSVRVSGKRLC